MSAELLATSILLAWSIIAFFLSLIVFRWIYERESKKLLEKFDIEQIKEEFEAIVQEKMQGALDGIPKIQSPNIPNMDLPNIPSPDLSAYAKKVESAFGALSSVVGTATKTYDRMIKKVLDAVMPIINKLQNISSMVDNLLNNDLAKCLLGITGANTGLPTPPTLGSSTLPDIKSIIGGSPLPMDLLKKA